MKQLIFVSCGRCGTVRLAQLLRQKLPERDYAVVHQMAFSRLANVVGNLLYRTNRFDRIKEMLYLLITAKHRSGRDFVCLDPLTAMIIPKRFRGSRTPTLFIYNVTTMILPGQWCEIVQKTLEKLDAHNLIHFGSPGLLPLENHMRLNPYRQYRQVSIVKNRFFYDQYGKLRNYHHIDMKDVFATDRLSELIRITIGESVSFTDTELSKKANES